MPTLTGIAGKLLTGSVSRVGELINEIKILAPDGAANDRFGYSVAVGNDRIVVGAYNVANPGVNTLVGAVYIYDLSGNLLNKITTSDGADTDVFGISVAVGDDRIVVGALSSVTSTYGSAYIFDLDGNKLAKIRPSDGVGNNYFGISVAIGSSKIVVGAFRDTVGGNTNQGSAYIYDLDGTNETKITASDGDVNEFFGSSIDIGSDRIVVGAYGDGDDSIFSGSVYIFDLDGTQLAKIMASDGAAKDQNGQDKRAQFGYSVAVGSGRIVVGAPNDDDNFTNSGSAYIYDLDGTNETKITASDGYLHNNFGWSVAVDDNKIVIGAPAYYSDTITFADLYSGKIYTYDLDGTNELTITHSDLSAHDRLGESLAVGNGRIVAGIRDDDNGENSGAVYIYKTANYKTANT